MNTSVYLLKKNKSFDFRELILLTLPMLQGSQVYVRGLQKAGMVTQEECESITKGLDTVNIWTVAISFVFTIYFLIISLISWQIYEQEQESIPVGCVLPTFVVGGGDVTCSLVPCSFQEGRGCLFPGVHGTPGWPRHRENREFGYYFFQTGKTQGILLWHREKFWDTGKIFFCDRGKNLDTGKIFDSDY